MANTNSDLVLTNTTHAENSSANSSENNGNQNQLTSSGKNSSSSSDFANKTGQLIEKFFTQGVSQTLAQAKQLYQKAGKMIEGERFIPVSAETVNGLLGRYVVKNIDEITELHAILQKDDFLLAGTLEASGVKASISGKFEVVCFVFNEQTQHMVFRQIGSTHIEKIYFDGFITQIVAKLGLWFLKYIKKRDLLGFALEYKEIASVRPAAEITKELAKETDSTDPEMGDEITIDLNRYFDADGTVLKNLKRFQVSDARIKDEKLQLLSRINLTGFFQDDTAIKNTD